MDILNDMGDAITPKDAPAPPIAGHPRAGGSDDGPRDALVIRSRLVPWAVVTFGLLAVGSALLILTTDHFWGRAAVVLIAVGLAVLAGRGARIRLVCDDDGVTSHQLVRSCRYPWSAVDRIGVADEIIIGARLADGRWVRLLHYRGLGDRSTTRAAEQVDRLLAMHATTPSTLDGWQRRPPPARWKVLVGLATLIAAVLTYSIASGNWFMFVYLGIQFALQRKYGDRVEPTFRPVGTGVHRPADPPTG